MRNLLILIALVVMAAILNGCHFKAKKPPVPECPSAWECSKISLKSDPICVPDEDDKQLSYTLSNRSTKHTVRVRYLEKVTHVNTVLPDEKIEKTIDLAKNRDRILGCSWTTAAHSGEYDRWEYTKISACFVGVDCDKKNNPFGPIPPEYQRPPELTCNQACDQGSDWCLKDSVSLKTASPDEARFSQGLYQFGRSLQRTAPTFDGSLDQLSTSIAALTGESCKRSRFYVKNGEFTNAGEDCSLYLDTASTAMGIDTTGIHLPSVWTADHGATANDSVLASIRYPETQRLYLSFYKEGDKLTFRDTIDTVETSVGSATGTMTMSTENSYCVRLEFEGG